MRVLLLSDFYPPVRGGLEAHVDGLAGELAARGFEVHVATLTPDPTPTDARVRVHVVASLAARVLPHEDPARPFHPPLPDPVARRFLRRLIDEVRPQVIHGHSWMTVSLPSTPSVPLVFTAHDYAMVCQLRTLLRSDGTACAGASVRTCVRCGADQYGALTSTLLATGSAVGARRLRPDAVVAVSRAVARALGPVLGRPARVIPNFLPPAASATPISREWPERFVMYAGDPGEHKGVGDLLAIWGGPRRPSADLVLAVTRPLDAVVPPGVHVARMERAEVLEGFARAAVAVVPSRWHDPCPTVAFEAMAAGTPLVAASVGGLVDIVRDGMDGFLVPPGDQATIAARIDELLADAELRNRMGASARERSASFSAGRVVDEIVALYGELGVPLPAQPEPAPLVTGRVA